MPVPVSEILNPTPPPPPPPPGPPPLTATETTVLKLLSSNTEQGYSVLEIRAHLSLNFMKRIGLADPFSIGGLAAMTALLILPEPKHKVKEQTAEEALETLLERGYAKTQEYKGVPYYWAVTSP